MSCGSDFDVVEIAQEASERAGVDFRSGYALRSARRALELLGLEWANRGLNLWMVQGPTSITLEPGVNQYALPCDAVDVVEHVVRTWHLVDPMGWEGPQAPVSTLSGQNAYTDLPLARTTFSEYAAIPNKLAVGRPTMIHVRRQIKPYFVLWLTPGPSPVYQVVIWWIRRMRSLGYGGGDEPEIPWRFIPAIVAGLAYYMSLKSKDPQALQKTQYLKAAYDEQFGLASDEDRDRASIHLVPGGYTRI